jgi:uncharacterized protein (DUF58 family)
MTNNYERWIDMSAIMRIEDLSWRAKTLVTGFYNGLHRSPKHGFSVEFSEHRQFCQGDDPRLIDWKLVARSDKYFIKKFEDETNRRCFIVLDQSLSMNYGSLEYKKLEYARTVAATLAYYWTLQRDAVGLITFDRAIGDVLPAKSRTGHFKRLLTMLARQGVGEATNLAEPIQHLAELVRQRSLIAIVSDFLVDVESASLPLSCLATRGHEVVLIQTLDPGETQWKIDESAAIRDMETGQEIYIDPQLAKSGYDRRFREHQTNWQTFAESHGMAWIPLRTDQSIEIALLELLKQQTRPGRTRPLPAGVRAGATGARS